MPLDPSGMRTLDPAIRTVWTLKLALAWGLLLIGALVFDTFQLFDLDPLLPAGLASALIAVAGSTATYLVPRLRFRHWRFELLPDELHLERGILNRVRTIVPLRRIQHLDVSQDVLEREFDLGKLIVHTAGTRSSDVVLPGLRLEEAEALRDRIKRYILEDALEDQV